MCKQYEVDFADDELKNWVLRYEGRGRNWPGSTKVFPNHEAPVIRTHGTARVVEGMHWGLTPWNKGRRWVVNFRHPLSQKWMILIENTRLRCIVPARAFAVRDKNSSPARLWWFERPDREPFFFAGVWTDWKGDRGTKRKPADGDHRLFSIMTTDPNTVVHSVHDKAMPVMLMTREHIEQWLEGTIGEALAIQKPAPDEAIRLAIGVAA